MRTGPTAGRAELRLNRRSIPWGHASRPNGPEDPSPGLRPQADALGQQSPQPRGLKGRESFSIPHVALIELDLIGLEEPTELLLKRLDPVMLALVADIGPNVFELRLAHRESAESRLPEEARELRIPTAKPVVRAFLELADDVAQRNGPCEEKQSVQVIGLGVDFDRQAAEAFERAAHVGMQIVANLVGQSSFAVLCRENEMNVDFGKGLSHGVGDSSIRLLTCQAGLSRPFRPPQGCCLSTQGIGLRPCIFSSSGRRAGSSSIGLGSKRPRLSKERCRRGCRRARTVAREKQPAFARRGQSGGQGCERLEEEELSVDKVFVGIDVSQQRLDWCVRPLNLHGSVDADEPGLANLVDRIAAWSGALVVLEATGGLERPIVAALAEKGAAVAVVNPRQVRDFARALGQLAKTDRIDAAVLALFAERIQPEPRPWASEERQHLEALLTRRRQLIDMLTAERNRLARTRPSAVRKSLQDHIRWLQRQIQQLDRDLDDQIQASPTWKRSRQ